MVLGSSSRNSISRGYLYGAVMRLQCSCNSCRNSSLAPHSLRSTTKALTIWPRAAVGLAHHGRLKHRRVLNERALNFERPDTVTRAFDDVVATANEPEIARFISPSPISRQIPVAREAQRGFSRIAPILTKQAQRPVWLYTNGDFPFLADGHFL